MAGDGDGTQHTLALPTLLTVRFAPRELPPGAVDLQDLSQFLAGLQRTLDAKVRHDFHVESIESERFRFYRFVIAEVRTRSVECDLIFNLYPNESDNGHVPMTTGSEAAPGFAPVELFKTSSIAADSNAGNRRVLSVERVLENMPEPLRRYLRAFLELLRNVTSPNPLPVSSELLDRAETGLKDMARVGAKASYAPGGVTIRANVRGEQSIVFNPATEARLRDILEDTVEGEQVVTVRGRVTALDIDQNTFRLQEFGHTTRLRCRYSEDEQENVLRVATPTNLVQAEGIPHFRRGSDRTWPPLYLKVSNVDLLPRASLWGVDDDQKAQ